MLRRGNRVKQREGDTNRQWSNAIIGTFLEWFNVTMCYFAALNAQFEAVSLVTGKCIAVECKRPITWVCFYGQVDNYSALKRFFHSGCVRGFRLFVIIFLFRTVCSHLACLFAYFIQQQQQQQKR